MEDIDLQRALDKLDEQERAIVVLRYFEEEKTGKHWKNHEFECEYSEEQTLPGYG